MADPVVEPITIAAPVRSVDPSMSTAPTVTTPVTVSSASTAPVVPVVVAPGPRVAQLGDDGEIPEDAELLSLSKAAFRSRLDRHTKRELKSRFGTDDPEEITAKLTRLADFERQQEEQRIANLSEIERERELREAAERNLDAVTQELQSTKDAQIVGQAHTRVEGIASKHLKPKVKGVVMEMFREHLKKLPDEEIDKLSDQDIEGWFTEQVKETPEFGRDYQAPIVVAPLTNGVRESGQTVQSPPTTGAQPATNYSPNAANAMSPAEARSKAAAEGYRW